MNKESDKDSQRLSTDIVNESRGGRAKFVKIILDAGADVNAKDAEGQTALMAASLGGHTDVVKILLDAGADVNMIGGRVSHAGYEGCFAESATALMCALSKGHARIVKMLLDAGADIDMKSYEGKTASDYARTDEMRALLSAYLGYTES